MSLDKKKNEAPTNMFQLPGFLANWRFRDMLVGKIMPIIEAAIPESKQQEAVKNLIKNAISGSFESEYQMAFSDIQAHTNESDEIFADRSDSKYSLAIWNAKPVDVKLDGSPEPTQ